MCGTTSYEEIERAAALAREDAYRQQRRDLWIRVYVSRLGHMRYVDDIAKLADRAVEVFDERCGKGKL